MLLPGAALVVVLAAAEEGSCGGLSGLFSREGAATLTVPPRVRAREALPDTHHDGVPETLPGASADFPAVFRYRGEAAADAAGRALRALVDERSEGAFVVRGLTRGSSEDFARVVGASGLSLREYIGGVTSRPEVAPFVTVISTERNDLSMEPHNDNPYWRSPPTHLVIYVERPPAAGGQALLCDGTKVLRALNETRPRLVASLVARGVRYEHSYPDGAAGAGGIVSWQDAFQTNDTASTERKLRAAGYAYEWRGRSLRTWEVAPAVAPHPKTGAPCWFNMITAMHCSVFDTHPDYVELNRPPAGATEPCALRGRMPYHTAFGDGEAFDAADVRAIREAQWAHSVAFDYAAGDVVVVDNYLAMHGRFSFAPPRDLFLTMVG